VKTINNHMGRNLESREVVPTLLSPNVAPDFAHHDGDEVLRCPGAKWHHAPAVLVVHGEEPASPYQKSKSRQQVFIVSSPTAWGKENFVQSGFHTCSTITEEPCVFSPPPICSIGEMEAMHSSIAF
jgi:hypothetical protein